MTKVRLLVSALLLVIGFSLPLASISAQTATEEADARAVLLQLIAHMSRGSGYQYSMNVSQFSTYTYGDGRVYHNVGIFTSAGKVDVQNNFQDTFTLQSGTSLTDAWNAPIFQIERVKIADETYLHLPKEFVTTYRYEFAPGWWRASDLRHHIVNPNLWTSVLNLINYPSPTRSGMNAQTITSVTDLGTRTIDQREVHVYDVTLDSVGFLLEQPHGTTLEEQVNVLKSRNLLDGNPSTVSAELWFGTEDGRLYGGRSNVDLLLPLRQIDSKNGYDAELNAAYTLSITYPDQPITITPPDDSLLNH